MKNFIFIILILSAGIHGFGQNPHLYWRFSNPAVYADGSDLFLDFDIELSCDIAGTYHCDIQTYLHYNSVAFGPEIIQTGNLELNKLELIQGELVGTPIYNFLPPGKSGTDTRPDIISIFTYIEFWFPPLFFHQVPLFPEWGGLMNIRMKILDPSQNAGIEFVHNNGGYNLMDGGQYYLDATHPTATKYGDPPGYECIFENDLLDFPLTNTLNLKVFLQGPYDTITHQMKTDLQQAGYIPLQHPFNPPLPYFENPDPCWYYTGTETADSIPQNTVDWVLIELRDAPDAASATPATTIAKKALFLMADGHIREPDGISLPIINNSVQDGLFVVVWHRNHAGIMNSDPLQPVSNGQYSYDFTVGPGMIFKAQYGATEIEPGIWGMAAGEGNADMSCNLADEVDVWENNAGNSGYFAGDLDLNGTVQLLDVHILYKNFGVHTSVPY